MYQCREELRSYIHDDSDNNNNDYAVNYEVDCGGVSGQWLLQIYEKLVEIQSWQFVNKVFKQHVCLLHTTMYADYSKHREQRRWSVLILPTVIYNKKKLFSFFYHKGFVNICSASSRKDIEIVEVWIHDIIEAPPYDRFCHEQIILSSNSILFAMLNITWWIVIRNISSPIVQCISVIKQFS